MKKMMIYLFVATMLISSCSKDDDDNDSSEPTTAKLIIKSTQDEAYNVYIDGDFRFTMGAYAEKEVILDPGSYYIEAREKYYTWSQNIYYLTITLEAGNSKVVDF